MNCAVWSLYFLPCVFQGILAWCVQPAKALTRLRIRAVLSEPLCIICLSTKLSSLLVETKLYKNTRGKNFISNFRPYKSTHTENVT